MPYPYLTDDDEQQQLGKIPGLPTRRQAMMFGGMGPDGAQLPTPEQPVTSAPVPMVPQIQVAQPQQAPAPQTIDPNDQPPEKLAAPALKDQQQFADQAQELGALPTRRDDPRVKQFEHHGWRKALDIAAGIGLGAATMNPMAGVGAYKMMAHPVKDAQQEYTAKLGQLSDAYNRSKDIAGEQRQINQFNISQQEAFKKAQNAPPKPAPLPRNQEQDLVGEVSRAREEARAKGIDPENYPAYRVAKDNLESWSSDKKQPKAGEEPLGDRVAQLNQMLEKRWQVLHPKEALPAAYVLPPKATQKDYDHIEKSLQATEAAEGTKAQRDTINAIRNQTVAMSQTKKDASEKAIEAAAQSLANGDLTRLRDIASLRGEQRIIIYQRAKEINPKFDPSDTDRQIKMEDWIANGKGSDQLVSFGTFLEHAGEASDVVNRVRNTDVKLINKPINWWRENVSSSPDFQQFLVALEPVRKEFESFLIGGHALQKEEREAGKVLMSDTSTPAQIQAALKQMGHTAKARLNEINEKYKRVRHRDIQEPVGPQAIEGARKIGVDLETPGKAAAPTADQPIATRKVGDTKTFANGSKGKWDGHGWVKQ